MPTVRVQAVLAKSSGIPRDAVTNTFHLETGSGTSSADYTTIINAFTGLYTGLVADGVIGQPISTASNAHVLKITNIDNFSQDVDTNSGPPDLTEAFTLNPAAGQTFPGQVAIAVTLESGSERFSEREGNTRPAARRRGRVFLPCIKTTCLAIDATSKEIYLDATIRSSILSRFTTLQSALASATEKVALVVASPTAGTTYPVEDFSIDDSFDVIRSRKVKARSRLRASAVVPVTLGA